MTSKPPSSLRRLPRQRSSPTWLTRLAAVAVALAASGALAADDDWTHRGSLGLLVASGPEFRSAPTVNFVRELGMRANVDLGGTMAISDSWELLLDARATFGGQAFALAFFGGVRNSYGERLKTFFELTAAVHVLPYLIVGPRGGFGVQYELSPIIGIFALAAVQFGGGATLRFGAEVTVGVQFRSYLLDL
ncbi:MAG: hypothetical protein JNG84_10385 [Archangium sp.]|nr:hypothetical protein [Archangium sp.]